jgi:hypothetical protein
VRRARREVAALAEPLANAAEPGARAPRGHAEGVRVRKGAVRNAGHSAIHAVATATATAAAAGIGHARTARKGGRVAGEKKNNKYIRRCWCCRMLGLFGVSGWIDSRSIMLQTASNVFWGIIALKKKKKKKEGHKPAAAHLWPCRIPRLVAPRIGRAGPRIGKPSGTVRKHTGAAGPNNQHIKQIIIFKNEKQVSVDKTD